jgi:CRP/FNR family transcriptional regulator, anaerobic regulatory protein
MKETAKAYRPAALDDCLACPARHIDLLSSADAEGRVALLQHFEIATFAPKEPIYRMGDPGEWLYLLRFGLAKLLRYSASGTERIVHLARTGDTIGTAAITGNHHRRTAVAMTPTEVCRIPGEVVRECGKTNPAVLDALLAQFQASADAADTFLTELSTGSAQVRMARLLLFLTEKHDHNEAPLPSREEMGALLGTTTETASRVIAEFRREGAIEMLHNDRCRCNMAVLNLLATL